MPTFFFLKKKHSSLVPETTVCPPFSDQVILREEAVLEAVQLSCGIEEAFRTPSLLKEMNYQRSLNRSRQQSRSPARLQGTNIYIPLTLLLFPAPLILCLYCHSVNVYQVHEQPVTKRVALTLVGRRVEINGIGRKAIRTRMSSLSSRSGQAPPSSERSVEERDGRICAQGTLVSPIHRTNYKAGAPGSQLRTIKLHMSVEPTKLGDTQISIATFLTRA